MHSKSVSDLGELVSSSGQETGDDLHPDMAVSFRVRRGSGDSATTATATAIVARKPSFLDRATKQLLLSNVKAEAAAAVIDDAPAAAAAAAAAEIIVVRKKAPPRVSRRTSFLESRPMRTLSKLTRR